jgi:hypothetical protein
MMGSQERAFAPLPPVSLEDVIPPDHFDRQLERALDLAFVRDLVRGAGSNRHHMGQDLPRISRGGTGLSSPSSALSDQVSL